MKVLRLFISLVILYSSSIVAKEENRISSTDFEEAQQFAIRASNEEQFMVKLSKAFEKSMITVSKDLRELNDQKLEEKYYRTVSSLKTIDQELSIRLGLNEDLTVRETLEVLTYENTKEELVSYYQELFMKHEGNIYGVKYASGFVKINTKSHTEEVKENIGKAFDFVLAALVYIPFKLACYKGCNFIF